MRLFHHVHSLRRPLALVLIPLVAIGCYSWKAAAVTPHVLMETEHPKAIRVTVAGTTDTLFADTDSTVLVVRSSMTHEVRAPYIAADTLRGLRDTDSVAVALRDITRVEVRRFEWRAPVAAVALIGLVALIAYLGYACADNPYC